jgi:hypothetical protein
MSWRADVPSGSPEARLAAKAQMALGELASAGVRRMGRAEDTDEFQKKFQSVTQSYSRASQHFGKVSRYGHTDLSQCALVRNGRLAEKLSDVVGNVKAPEELAAMGDKTAAQFEKSHKDTSKAYLKTAKGLYEAATRMPGGDAGCRTEARDGVERMLQALGQRVP